MEIHNEPSTHGVAALKGQAREMIRNFFIYKYSEEVLIAISFRPTY
jgi:hypothetical protein